MKPFIIRGQIQNGNVIFNVKSLNFQQRQFVQACAAQLNQDPKTKTATQADSLAYIMYKNKSDFLGAVITKLANKTPDQAWAEFESDFNKADVDFPKVGMRYTRAQMLELTPDAGRIMDMLNDGGCWPWINARAVFEKQGDEMVVIGTI